MENQVYRLELSNKAILELWVCDTNECEPYRKTKEMAVTIHKGEMQLDGSLDNDDIDSLIKYLKDCKKHIRKFNDASEPLK